MRRVPRLLTAAVFLSAIAACSEEVIVVPGEGTGPGTENPDPNDPNDPNDPSNPNNPNHPDNPNNPINDIADLRADTNRDGVIKFDDPTDDEGEDVWDEKHGAVFLANIDDDEEKCPRTGDDVDLPKCNDAADEVLNGADDALDLARLKTRPFPKVADDATATFTWTNADRVRLFRVKGSTFSVIQSGAKLTPAEMKEGVELAIEAKDIVRDTTAWDGYVEISYKVASGGQNKTDKVKMRVSPLMTYHHVSPLEYAWSSASQSAGNIAMRTDLNEALTAAGLPAVKTITTNDQWNQDYFEPGFMTMPAAGGKQHAIRVNIRSANVYQNPSVSKNPLRPAGRSVFTVMRGKDNAAIQEFDKVPGSGRPDTLNSFGNFETIPPYKLGNEDYPMGRVLRGSIPGYAPDKTFTKMIEAQKVQPPVYVDTEWLAVGHVDETLSFVRANNPRGWVMLVNDAAMAKKIFEDAASAGYGNVPMFVGKYWGQNSPAQITINQTLADTDVMASSAEAVVEVNAQVAALKTATGITDAELVKIPFLHMSSGSRSIAFQPGMVNGIYIAPGHFVSPDPHGPVINGTDIFKAAMSSALAPYQVTVHYAEDWDTYHRAMGEVHCGTNSTRQIPAQKWWESGR